MVVVHEAYSCTVSYWSNIKIDNFENVLEVAECNLGCQISVRQFYIIEIGEPNMQ